MTLAAQPETSRTVDRALVLLHAVGEHAPASSAELARRTGLNRTVVHRLLSTLAARGFVRRDADGYALGTALIQLSGRVHAGLRERARPVLETLAARFDETAVLTVADGQDAVAIDQVLGGEHLVRVHYAPGFRHPLTKGAHGRAILERRWVVSHDELQLGAFGGAAPLFDARGEAVASVGIVAPFNRFPDPDSLAAATLAAITEMEV